MWGVFLLNQGDRQVFNSVIPLIREGLGLSDVQIGLVGTIFTAIDGIPVAGDAGDVIGEWLGASPGSDLLFGVQAE